MFRVSASSIKTLNTCSFQFWYFNVLKAPSFKSPKTSVGSVAHTILEVLFNKERRRYVEHIVECQDIYVFPSVKRLAIKHLNKYGINDKIWIKDLNNLVLGGLIDGFFEDGAIKKLKPEHEFWVKDKDFEVRGFIDRAAIYPPSEKYPQGYVKISDYKSQRDIFTEEEINWNIQAFIYQWALYREFGLPVVVEFILLRHGIKQVVDWCGEDKIKGTISYLGYISDHVQDFDLKKASTNFAYDDKDKEWLCAKYVKSQYELKKDGQPKFCCFARFPKTLYVVKDEDNNIKYSVEKPEDIPAQDWDNVVTYKHKGCPKFYHD